MSSLPLHLFDPVLTTAAMRQADEAAIRDLGIPGRLLMENAGREAVSVLERWLGSARERRVLVVCGKGNNGGDGLVMARVLHARGASVRAVVLGAPDDLSPDAATNLRLLQEVAPGDGTLEIQIAPSHGEIDRTWPEWVVDAVLGIGARAPVRSPLDAFVRAVNECAGTVIAIDVPSGLDSDSGRAADPTVRAGLTVTMGAVKAGLLIREGPAHAGDVHVVDIGIPRRSLDSAVSEHGAGFASTDAAVAALVPRRKGDAHKYSAGRVFVVAGSRAFPGAAVLAGLGAARAGAGAVVVAAPESARQFLETNLIEVMTTPTPETADGTLAPAALDDLRERAAAADAVVVGPGLGRHPDTQRLIGDLLATLETPCVIDADALNALSDGAEALAQHRKGSTWILTPHAGEMQRLAGGAPLADLPWEVAAEWSRRLHCTLLLKGAPSVVGATSGEVLISGISTPAMATAGSGDVLAGMIAGLLAQGMEAAAASIAALHLGGRAAQHFGEMHSPQTMLASDVLAHLPAVFPR